MKLLSFSMYSLYITIFVCMYAIHMYSCMYVCMCTISLGVFLCCIPPCVLQHGLSLNLEITDCFNWLDKQHQGSSWVTSSPPLAQGSQTFEPLFLTHMALNSDVTETEIQSWGEESYLYVTETIKDIASLKIKVRDTSGSIIINQVSPGQLLEREEQLSK